MVAFIAVAVGLLLKAIEPISLTPTIMIIEANITVTRVTAANIAIVNQFFRFGFRVKNRFSG